MRRIFSGRMPEAAEARRSSRDRRETENETGPRSAPGAPPGEHQRQRPQGDRTPAAARAADLPRERRRPSARRPAAPAILQGRAARGEAAGHDQQPRQGHPQQIRTGTQDQDHRRDQQDPGRPPAFRTRTPPGFPGLTGNRSGRSEARDQRPDTSDRNRRGRQQQRKTDRKRGKRAEKGPDRNMDGWNGDRERLRACISSRIGTGSARRTSAGTVRRSSACCIWQALDFCGARSGGPSEEHGRKTPNPTIPICNLNSNLDFGFGFWWISCG